ncbi:hypothetical protein R1T16_16320 [Flavobacterium sp. DG1-102-2]|uniref:hypothetical protein n=1 Tax=Flavobacterium sp. DG1-102-2 TaxID=3081663 RepID=UPI00294A1C82|nr:hypothetical protein [Flavobacterium sp. DG1-102-2]MDV6170005.1 hypothetical protein [Flavobacterium sp. DG1-102-2]
MDTIKQRSPLRSILIAIVLFLLGRNIILAQNHQIDGAEDIFRQLSGYFTITLASLLAIVTVYRIIKDIFPKRG